MAGRKGPAITGCTISGSDAAGSSIVVTRVLQTEIQIREYSRGALTGGMIKPIPDGAKAELFRILLMCVDDRDREIPLPKKPVPGTGNSGSVHQRAASEGSAE